MKNKRAGAGDEKIETVLWERFGGADERLLKSFRELIADADAACGAAGKNLVFQLLDQYTFITRDAYDQSIECIAEHIDSEYDMSRTLLCATTADHSKDSAQVVLYDLTTAMGLLGHSVVHTANRYDRAQVFSGKVDDIILVDEFLGTGRSMAGRIREIRSHFKNKRVDIPKIHAIVIAGMDFGLKRVLLNFDSVNTCFSLRPGLRGYFSGGDLKRAYEILEGFEVTLAPFVRGNPLPKKGDGQCEALYSRKKGNCPNSVLPMFWWPELASGSPRTPPFTRIF